MNVNEVLTELEALGNDNTKRILTKHGAREPFFGVKVGDLKKVLKKIKGDQQLALDLYDTGNSDAMYLAGLAADGSLMSREELQKWVENAYWYMISEYTVPWAASEHEDGWKIALEWTESDEESVAAAGWATLSSILSVTPDEELDRVELERLLKRVEKEIGLAKNRVRYTMNGFVIAAGGFVSGMTSAALAAAEKIGKVSVDVGGTACKVPFAPDYIRKMEVRGVIGKKKKTAKC